MSEPDPARGRFIVMQLVRLSGVVLVLFGVLLQAGRIEALRDVPVAAAYVLIVIGLVEVFALPLILARHWRTPKE
jgi:hypothetical protein